MLTCVLNGGILVDEVKYMDFGINIGYVSNMVGMEKAAELIAKTGFTCVDYTPPVKHDNWKEIFESDMEIMKKYGLRVEQTHGPFNRYGSYGETHAQAIERVYEATVLSGAKFMVIHGDEYPENAVFDEKTALQYNHDMYLPYVRRAEKDGVKLAFETVFEDPEVVENVVGAKGSYKAFSETTQTYEKHRFAVAVTANPETNKLWVYELIIGASE